MGALVQPFMLTEQLPFRGHDEPIRVDPQADQAVRKQCGQTITVPLEADQAGAGRGLSGCGRFGRARHGGRGDGPTPENAAAFEQAVLALKEVLDCNLVAGDFDYLLKIRVRGMADSNKLHCQKLIALPGVRQTRTFFVMKRSRTIGGRRSEGAQSGTGKPPRFAPWAVASSWLGAGDGGLRSAMALQPVGIVPPSMTCSDPVIAAARSEARNAIRLAISAGLAGRPMGMPPSESMTIFLPLA